MSKTKMFTSDKNISMVIKVMNVLDFSAHMQIKEWKI